MMNESFKRAMKKNEIEMEFLNMTKANVFLECLTLFVCHYMVGKAKISNSSIFKIIMKTNGQANEGEHLP